MFETVIRSRTKPLTARDLCYANLIPLLMSIVEEYVPARCKELKFTEEETAYCMNQSLIGPFMKDCLKFAQSVSLAKPDVLKHSRIVFEGAQGLALDQNNKAGFPYLTPSNTGLQNVFDVIDEMGNIDKLEACYVSRSYLTRHGAGPLPGEWKPEEVPATIYDNTNVPHDFQGTLRFAPLNWLTLFGRAAYDWDKQVPSGFQCIPRIALTCLDQLDFAQKHLAHYNVFGPTARDVKAMR